MRDPDADRCGQRAIFGVISLRRARAAETLAERARGEAEKLVGFLIEDFYTELEPTGRLETMGKLSHMAVAYFDGLPPELLTPGTQVYRGMALCARARCCRLAATARVRPRSWAMPKRFSKNSGPMATKATARPLGWRLLHC